MGPALLYTLGYLGSRQRPSANEWTSSKSHQIGPLPWAVEVAGEEFTITNFFRDPFPISS